MGGSVLTHGGCKQKSPSSKACSLFGGTVGGSVGGKVGCSVLVISSILSIVVKLVKYLKEINVPRLKINFLLASDMACFEMKLKVKDGHG